MKKPHPDIKGFSERNLQLIIQFQKEYSGLFEDLQRPVAELPEAFRTGKIWPQPVAKFETDDSTQPAQGSGENQIVQQSVAQLSSATMSSSARSLRKMIFTAMLPAGSAGGT